MKDSLIKGKDEYIIKLLGERLSATDSNIALYQQKLNRIMHPSPPLVIDGQLGSATLKVLYEFQRSHGLIVDGRIGPETIKALNQYDPLSNYKIESIDNKPSLFDIYLNTDFLSWKEGIAPFNNFIAVFDLTTIVGVSKTTIHINWDKIVYGLVYKLFLQNGPIAMIGNTQLGMNFKWKNPYKEQKLIEISQGHKRSVGNFTAYKIGILRKYEPLIDKIKTSSHLSLIGTELGAISILFECANLGQKKAQGTAKFIDFANLTLDTATFIAEPLHDCLIKGSSTAQKIPIKRTIQNLGKAIVKTRYAKLLTKAGVSTAGVATTTSLAIVGFQCVGAFMLGWEIGKFIEDKTHLGEKSIDWLWGTFLGELVKDFIDWKVNRVVCIQYPPDWTQQDIENFQNKLEKNN